MSIDQFSDLGTGLLSLTPAYDNGVPRFRPLIVVSEQAVYGQSLAEQRAQWERARRYGRSQAVRLTCDSWRDGAGKLWTPNFFAPVDLPALKINSVSWIVGEVTFSRNEGRGTVAELTLMPKEAFSVEPSGELLFDWQVEQALQEGGAANDVPQDAGTSRGEQPS